jgi:hypothetical protein
MEERKIKPEKKLTGRPNQGKTETIKQRKVDVYLPTIELMGQWRETAEASGMPLSKYILEVVEQHRQGAQRITMPPAMLEEKANKLEKENAALQMRFDTLNLAFHNQEVELSRLHSAYQDARVGGLDIPMLKSLIQAFEAIPGKSIHAGTLMISMKINTNNPEQTLKWTDGLNLLLNVGLLVKEPNGNLKWKNGR